MSIYFSESIRALPKRLRASRHALVHARRRVRRGVRPRVLATWLGRLSIFEKVIVANSVVILLDTVAGWWITQHDPETYHYLIDTSFIAAAAIIGLGINFALLRAAFAPLHAVLATIHAVEQGDTEARAAAPAYDADALALARAFNAMLDELARQRDEAAARILHAQEDERRQVALELHDQTGQNLTALALRAEALAQQLGSDPDSAGIARARAQVERLGTLAQQMLVDVQALSRQLRPPLLDDLGLAAALRWLASDGGTRLGVTVLARVRGLAEDDALQQRLPGDTETALFRIAQECLTNAARHGRAQHIRMSLVRRAAHITLTVADDGSGFVVPAAVRGNGTLRPGQQHHGMGIEGMRERTRMLGGELTIRTTPGAGTAVRASVPLPQPVVRTKSDTAIALVEQAE